MRAPSHCFSTEVSGSVPHKVSSMFTMVMVSIVIARLSETMNSWLL